MSIRNTTTVQGPRAAGDPVVMSAQPQRPAPVAADSAFYKANILKRWKLVLATAVVISLLAGILAALQPKHYRASTIAGVTATGEHMDAGELYRGVEVLQQRTIVATVAALASVPETQRQLAARGNATIDAVVLPNTNLLRIDVDSTDPTVAAEIANRVPTILDAQTRSMYKLYGVATVSAAAKPTAPVSPRIARAMIAGAILGLLIGLAGAVAKSFMRHEPSSSRLTNAVPAS